MIETTYIRLAKAAEVLGTDQDTLLIAAAEGRIQLYWLLNSVMGAELGCYEEPSNPDPDGPPSIWVMHDAAIRHFMFVPLPSPDAAALLKKAAVEWSSSQLTLPAADGTWWSGSNEMWGIVKTSADWNRITVDAVFVSRENVETIKAAHKTPAPGTVKDAPLPQRSIPRDSSLIATIAALLSTFSPSETPSGKDLERAAQSLGLTVSDDTIRKVLKAAQEAAPSLRLPK